MKTVLIFTYYWPPSSAVSVWRFLKMSKFLPEYGWMPVIVTVQDGAFTAVDADLEKEVPDFVEVHRTKSRDPYRIYNWLRGAKGKNLPDNMAGIVESKSLFKRLSFFIRANFFVPDPKIGWVPFAVRKGAELIKSRQIDAIITTGPPNSVHLIGKKLKDRYKLPWIMDMRDPWTSYYLVSEFMKRSKWATARDKRLETTCLRSADVVVGVSGVLMEEFKDRANRVEVVSNGFDESDFEFEDRQPTSKFELTYVGSLKPNQNVRTLWEAIAQLNAVLPGFKENFRLRFIGNLNPHINEQLIEMGLGDQLSCQSFVPHRQAIKHMQNATLLLFIIPDARYARAITTGKLFEYLAAASPVLSIGPINGEAAHILKETGRSPMSDWTDKEGILSELKSQFETWQANGGLLPAFDYSLGDVYNRRTLTGQLAKILDEIV